MSNHKRIRLIDRLNNLLRLKLSLRLRSIKLHQRVRAAVVKI